MFSSRLPASLEPNRLALARARLVGRPSPQVSSTEPPAPSMGAPLFDLTESNPTVVGLPYPPGLLDPLADPRGLAYTPEPFGLEEARAAVADDYRRRGHAVAPDRIALTASTSEAYGLLFKLLCDPGDRVLVPRPSYPLLEHLAALDAVELAPYDLDDRGAWRVDLAGLEAAATGRARAVVLVSPNNPTGSVHAPDELAAIGALCRARGLALIADEVFADYPLGDDGLLPSALDDPAALTFGLGGLSKSIGLPQAKLAWIGVGGPADLVRDAIARLEIVCDAYLSVATPVQIALPRLLREGAAVRARIAERVRANLACLRRRAAADPACTVLDVMAGWSAVIQVPAVLGEEALALDLLEQAGVLVHPGYFFDFPREAFLVVSLIPRPDTFGEGVDRLFGRLAELRAV